MNWSAEYVCIDKLDEHKNVMWHETLEDLVRCKDCIYFSQTTLGMDYACWHEANKIYGESGKSAGSTVCTRIESPFHYCGYGRKRDGSTKRTVESLNEGHCRKY